MKAKLLSIASALFFILLIVACKKDNAGPKINLKLKDVNGTSFALDNPVIFKFDFTAKNPENDTLFIVRKFFTCPYLPKPDTIPMLLPKFDNKNKGELIYTYEYSGQSGIYNAGCYTAAGGGVRRTDSLTFSFWVKDKDGNISDTVQSSKIILIK